MATGLHNPTSPQPVRKRLEGGELTVFFIWLLISASAAVIMAQDTWVNWGEERHGTIDATAAFTKILVIHGLWLIVTLSFMIYTWFIRPVSIWKLHLIMGAMVVIWTTGVLVWAFDDTERLHITVWRCDVMPAGETVTPEFLDTCSPRNSQSTLRLGPNIYLWSLDDVHYSRWIVPADTRSTIQAQWPRDASAVFMAPEGEGQHFLHGVTETGPGGVWSAAFNPREQRDLELFFIENAESPPTYDATPAAMLAPGPEFLTRRDTCSLI